MGGDDDDDEDAGVRKKTKQKGTGGGKKESSLTFTGSYLPTTRAHPPPPHTHQLARKLAICGAFGKGGGVTAEPLKSLLPIAGGSLNKIRFKWQEPNFCKPPRSIFWLKLKDEY